MKTEQIIKTLQNYNDWRRARGKWDVDTFNEGKSFFDSVTAHDIGLTIDAAIERLQTLGEERDEARELAVKLREYYEGEPEFPEDLFPWEKGAE